MRAGVSFILIIVGKLKTTLKITTNILKNICDPKISTKFVIDQKRVFKKIGKIKSCVSVRGGVMIIWQAINGRIYFQIIRPFDIVSYSVRSSSEASSSIDWRGQPMRLALGVEP